MIPRDVPCAICRLIAEISSVGPIGPLGRPERRRGRIRETLDRRNDLSAVVALEYRRAVELVASMRPRYGRAIEAAGLRRGLGFEELSPSIRAKSESRQTRAAHALSARRVVSGLPRLLS